MKATDLLYLTDTYLFEKEANVVLVDSDEIGDYVVVDQTIFYPQGGGQPSDVGIIANEIASFVVNNVRKDDQGVVRHYGTWQSDQKFTTHKAQLKIDSELRILHAKLHSAGHLLDCAVEQLGLPIKPVKGFHFPVGTYVEYEGVLDNPSQYAAPLEQLINELVSKNLELIVTEQTLPDNTLYRFVEFKGYKGCGCAGTHITTSNELGKITVRKLKNKSGNTKISYSFG